MNPECVIVDASIAFKALVANRGDLRNRLGSSATITFYSPRFLFVELFKHKQRLSAAAKLPADELMEALYTLVSRLELVNEANIPVGTWMEAHRLCHDVDEKDTPYIALTLYLEGRFWTDDKH
jgi:predicted nucleic acid-binding protein